MDTSATSIIRQGQKIRNAMLAGLVPRALRSIDHEQRMVEATQKANHRVIYGETPDMPDEGDDTVNVDSPHTVNHYHAAPAEAATTQNSGLGPLAKLAIGGALLATGAGAGAGLPLLLSGGKDVVEQVIQQGEQRQYSLSLGSPDEPGR